MGSQLAQLLSCRGREVHPAALRCLLSGALQCSGAPEQVADGVAPVGECLLSDGDEHVLLEAAGRVLGVEVLAVGEALELADVPERNMGWHWQMQAWHA